MKLLLGPILSFKGIEGNQWKVSCLYVTNADIPLLEYSVDKGVVDTATAKIIFESGEKKAWRFDLAIELNQREQSVSFCLKDLPNYGAKFHVPPHGNIPKIAYGSCNGFSLLKDMKKVEDKNFLWKDMAQKHSQGPYHILTMGGDQVYADQIWEAVPSIKKWAQKSRSKRITAPFTITMKKEVDDFYFKLYCERWSQPEVQKMFSSVPTIMMWDDHDIFDGWGSHLEAEQASPVFQGIFDSAKRHFNCFQQQLSAAERHPFSLGTPQSFSTGFVVGKLALLVLDMRSERTNNQVLSAETWKSLYQWMDTLPETAQHVYILSSIPVVHPDFGLIEGLLGVFPGQQELEDDLRDHWHSRGHRAERLRLIHRLLVLSEKHRVTILSGDVHVAALGVVQSERNKDNDSRAQVINQFTSSGIVHPAPPGAVLLALKILGAQKEHIDQGITAELINFPGSGHSFIGSRNWLSLEPDTKDDRVWANWFVESEINKNQPPYTKVIHPLHYKQTAAK